MRKLPTFRSSTLHTSLSGWTVCLSIMHLKKNSFCLLRYFISTLGNKIRWSMINLIWKFLHFLFLSLTDSFNIPHLDSIQNYYRYLLELLCIITGIITGIYHTDAIIFKIKLINNILFSVITCMLLQWPSYSPGSYLLFPLSFPLVVSRAE